MSVRFSGLIVKNFKLPTPYIPPAAIPSYKLDNKFNYVQLLLRGDAISESNNTVFLDSSINNFQIVPSLPASSFTLPSGQEYSQTGQFVTQGTDSPYSVPDGFWSTHSQFSENYDNSIYISPNTAIDISTNDFTIETWVYVEDWSPGITSTGDHEPVYFVYLIPQVIFSYGVNYPTLFATYENENAHYICSIGDGSSTIQLTGVMKPCHWQHIVISRTGNKYYFYVDGELSQTGTHSSSNLSVSSNNLFIGSKEGGNSGDGIMLQGYISNFRIINGNNIYSGINSFSPPLSPLSAIANTGLLTCQSNIYKDNSINNLQINPNFDATFGPKCRKFSPFGNPSSNGYSSLVSGGSVFLGGGGYLTLPTDSNLTLDGDFTIDFWMNYYATNNYDCIFGAGTSMLIMTGNIYSNSMHLELYHQGVGGQTLNINNLGLDQWYHIVISRTSGTLTAYCNGIQTNSINDSYTYDLSADYIGNTKILGSLAFPFCGRISDFRVVKGTGLYTNSTYSVPTSPVTADSGTTLLLNGINAGIYDSSGNMDIIPYGNPKISADHSTFGNTSIYFDGSSYLTGSPAAYQSYSYTTGDIIHDIMSIRQADYTIECWYYLTNLDNSSYVLSDFGWAGTTYTTSPRISLLHNGGELYPMFYDGNTSIQGTSTTPNSWHHIAVSRINGVTRLFQDGIKVGVSKSDLTYDLTCYTIFGSSIGATINNGTPTNYFYGYIDDFRFTKGIGRYSTDFTLPNTNLPDIYVTPSSPGDNHNISDTLLISNGDK